MYVVLLKRNWLAYGGRGSGRLYRNDGKNVDKNRKLINECLRKNFRHLLLPLTHTLSKYFLSAFKCWKKNYIFQRNFFDVC